MKMNWTASKTRKCLGALAVFLALALVAAGFAFQNARTLFSMDSGPVKADMIIVLGGGGSERPEQAAELFREQAAGGVIVSGRGDCDTNRAILINGGVPAEAIETECESRSTKQNALFTLPMLRRKQAHRVILVTTWYHSRRALTCFRHYAPGIEFYSRPSFYGSERAEWKGKGVRPYIWKEFLKVPGYWLVYGVRPW
jgi:uncharacterized SAM-binding protein YcdF (DUF218 family)